MRYVVSLVLAVVAGAPGQWSDPVPVLRGSSPVVGQSLVPGSGDTVWAAVVRGRAGSSGPYQVLVCYSTGDTWSLPYEVTPSDSGLMFSEPGMGRDPDGRLWVAWYRGAYPVCDVETSAVWTAVRDLAGWHAPVRAFTGVAAGGPMSFAADLAGNWYLGFSASTADYSSAMFSRWGGGSWLTPRYIARGMSSPVQTDFSTPSFATRPDSGVWAAYQMSVGGLGITMVKTVRPDTARPCCGAEGYSPAVTADSAGRLWLFYSSLNWYLLRVQVIAGDDPLDTIFVSDMTDGPASAGTDFEGLVWAAWPTRSTGHVSVSYCRDMVWSNPETASDLAGSPVAVTADATGSIYVLFRTDSGQPYTVRRLGRPGIEDGPKPQASSFKSEPTILTASSLGRLASSVVYDAMGRRVRNPKPGVYFVGEGLGTRGQGSGRMRKVVISR